MNCGPDSKADEHDFAGDFRHAVANFELNSKIGAMELQNMREIVAKLVGRASICDTKRVVKHIMPVQNHFAGLRRPGGYARVAIARKYLACDRTHVGGAQWSAGVID